MRKFIISSLSCGLLAVMLAPGNAVVLEQKWVAGEKLAYDVTLAGIMNLQAPADAPVLWAGLPLEVDLLGKGQSVWQTLSVDENGTASVVIKVPAFKMTGETLGQRGELRLEQGITSFFLNGKVLALGQDQPGMQDASKMLMEPPVALKFSRTGKLTGFESLRPSENPTPKSGASKPTDKVGGAAAVVGAVDRAALAQALILRALPALWPSKDVQAGESWKATVAWPNPTPTTVGTPLGAFDLTLQGTEVVEGKTLWRVNVEGGLEMDAAKLQQVNMPGAGGKTAGALTAAKQKMTGSLWFDAEKGQLAKVDLKISGEMAGRGPAVEGKAASETWTDFNGSLQLTRAKPKVQ